MIKGNEELYSHIARPIPLLPRKTYCDDKPRSHQAIIDVRKFNYNSTYSKDIVQNQGVPGDSPLSSGVIDYLCDNNSNSIVFKRNLSNNRVLGPNLLNLVKMTSNLDKFSKPIDRNPPLRLYYIPYSNDRTLVFESRFECGNLELAVKVTDEEYNLVLQHDVNTAGNTQWFFFRVSNTTQDMTVKFNIINLGKGDSLYNYGMKILFFSESDEKQSSKGWQWSDADVVYYKNNMFKPNTSKSFYSMSFDHSFTHTKDTVYFAYSYPYTYTDLMKYLLSLENSQNLNHLFSRKLLCYTIGGNRCDYLTITSSEIPEYMKGRKGVVISARVHPGESVGSWMMHGVIEFLLSDCNEAAIIRDNFVVKVIPMLNPDGVINGNYRCNLAGCDLNRKWKAPSKVLQPTIYYAKRLMKIFSKERKIALVCDLHGHSRRMNTFMYGCNIETKPTATREFPYILSKLCEKFDYKSCSFHMQKSKESTLRISMFNELQIPNVYTLEASFCGDGKNHYTIEDLKLIGKKLCLALLAQLDCELPKEISINKESALEELKSNEELLVDSNDTSGSDSEPSEDNLDEEVLKTLIPKALKKKKKKTKTDRKASVIKKRESLPARTDRKSLSVDKEKEKRVERKKCVDCGELDVLGHICVKKKMVHYSPSPNLYKRKERTMPASLTSLTTYVNVKGKKVRDQATQTMYIKRKEGEPRVAHSVSLINAIEKTPSPGKYRLENYIDTNRLKDLMLVRHNPYLLQ